VDEAGLAWRSMPVQTAKNGSSKILWQPGTKVMNLDRFDHAA
jgi:hypothetical protein